MYKIELLTLDDFDMLYEIMESSFIEDERRTYSQHLQALRHEKCSTYGIKENSILLGFITTYDFDDFVYLEHFAIKESYRNKGLGRLLLNHVLSLHNKLMILEVEIPVDEITKRRINFYRSFGFVLNDYYYLQPAYDIYKSEIPLLIMSKPQALCKNTFLKIRDTLYKEVYKKY